MINCKRCGTFGKNESEIELHHKVPRCIGGTDADGRVYLCKKCHDIWHGMFPKFLWKCVPEDKQKEAQQYLKTMCEWFIKNHKK